MSDGKVAETPDEFDADLHGRSSDPAEGMPTAHDFKDLHEKLSQFHTDELKRIFIVPNGTALSQGGVYVDLERLERGEFTANHGIVAEEGARYVPKSEVDYTIWDRLLGIQR